MATTCRFVKARTMSGTTSWLVVAVVGLFVLGHLVVNAVSRGDENPPKSGSKLSAQKAAQTTKPDDEEDLADDELERDDDLTALVVPSPLLAKAETIDKLKFAQELRGLLMEGMGSDGDSLAAAKRHFQALHGLVADDPRAPYGFGISLLSQKKSNEALDQFGAAASLVQSPYLPALQGIAWVHILNSNYAKGLPAVLNLARKIAEAKGPWPADHDRQHSAEWLGRMIGYLSGPGMPSDQAAEIENLAGEIDKLLTHELNEAYHHGRQSIAGRYEKMKSLAARPVEETLANARQSRQELLAAAQAAAADLKRLEGEIREITKPYDKQVADWNHDLRTKATRHKQAAQDLAEASDEVAYFSVPQVHIQVRSTGGRYRRLVPSLRPENAQEKKSREAQLASVKQREQQAQSVFDETKQQMIDIKSQRMQAATEHRKGTADKRRLITEARKKCRETAARLRDVEHLELTPESIKSRVTALETYVPLDPETEKSRLLATLKAAS